MHCKIFLGLLHYYIKLMMLTARIAHFKLQLRGLLLCPHIETVVKVSNSYCTVGKFPNKIIKAQDLHICEIMHSNL